LNLQHEFGLFGGEWGVHLNSFLKELQKPLVTTLHTVLPDFEPKAQTVLNSIIAHSASLVVMTQAALHILKKYTSHHENIHVIPHGCPDVPFVPLERAKAALGLKDHIVLITFGMIGPGKGIEHAIEALSSLVGKEPRLLYLILGETHPNLRRIKEERYRMKLMQLVDELNIGSHVRFHNNYLPKPELIKYLQAADIVITPYLDPNQVTSGTLTWALGEGKVIVSTPYLHAKEALAEGRGLLAEFKNPASIAKCINKLLNNKRLREDIEKKAYKYGRDLIWPKVAKTYINLFCEQIKHKEYEHA